MPGELPLRLARARRRQHADIGTDSSVSRPETLPANSRGLTTQKIVWSVSSGSACRVVATRTLTWVWSGVSSVLCTVPRRCP